MQTSAMKAGFQIAEYCLSSAKRYSEKVLFFIILSAPSKYKEWSCIIIGGGYLQFTFNL